MDSGQRDTMRKLGLHLTRVAGAARVAELAVELLAPELLVVADILVHGARVELADAPRPVAELLHRARQVRAAAALLHLLRLARRDDVLEL